MNRKDYILFDLDGALTDPKEGVTKSMQHALEHLDIQTDDLDSLTPFIGPPLRDSFKRYHGFSDKQTWEGVQAYRECFSVRGWVQNKEHPGIKEMLEALKEAGRVLLVAISKPEEFTKKILDHFDMTEYFDFTDDADMRETRMHRADIIRCALKQYGLGLDNETIGRCVMVGDREHDVLGARECGIGCMDMFYGCGDHQEMGTCRPAWIAETVKDLRDLLLSL